MADPRQPTELTVSDRHSIEDLLASYVLNLDVDDIDAAAALFLDDAEFVTYGRVFAGRERIRRMFASAPKGLHLSGRALIVAAPHGADVSMQLVFFPADDAPRRLAVYDLGLVRRTDAGWAIRRMECRFLDGEGKLAAQP
ncbi:nuclear transport factor 2 family protein [Gordonia rhizosphera]|uniref:SnoaL-like domain-containing protein n=1 Tax=Gordonia rhizosphera NBRC 16068 TaxID=1108045 RepID=K6WSM6_9ACTN|nr:nuclear transport factor 2 family protein [Gordonia rhizosphera]GAB89569.1 hypothetical protein GORHZ_065_00340 [Gordonia rhizosphera NBRC 16068]